MGYSKPIRRHFFLIAAVLVLVVMTAAGAYKVFSAKSAGSQAAAPSGGAPASKGSGRAPPATVTAVFVEPRVFQETIEVMGVAKGRQSVTLTAAATQLVERVRFTDGQRVARGAVLVELRGAEQVAGVAQAEARLLAAKRAFDRYRTLREKGWVSNAQVDEAEAAWGVAQADVGAARARQGDRVIRAPFAGVVGLSDVAPGALVNPGAPIVTLDDVSVIRVDFQVPEQHLGQLREGQTILATAAAYPGETIAGRVFRLDSRVDERSRAITARAEFPNEGGRLKPGMLIRVGVSRGQRSSPGAPESAVSIQGENAFVYVLTPKGEAMAVEQRPIVTGIRQQGFVEIIDGLKPGEQIVADGLNKIQAGQTVRLDKGSATRTAAGTPPEAPRTPS
jgi:membrane fusion protein, multidrug efflux system